MSQAERVDRLAAERDAERRALDRADAVLVAYGGIRDDLNKAMPFLRSAANKSESLMNLFNSRDIGDTRLKRYLRVVHLAKLTKSVVSHLALTVRVMDSVSANSSSVRVLSVEQEPPFTDV